MIDFARITVKAGKGGDGGGSFHKIKGKRYGKADGGNGGKGGDVYIEATGDLTGLDKYRFVKDYKAQNGQVGASKLRRGAQGADLVLFVPVGTQVKVTELQRAKGDKEIDNSVSSGSLLPLSLFDMVEPGQKILVARGGEGGRGNAHLRDEFGRRPKSGEKGEDGEAFNVTLELKLIADIGLVGLPNAGKSTLIAKLTAAKPKIAAYPFTTLEPNLGVIQLPVLGFQLSDKGQSVNQLTGQLKTGEPNSENRRQKTDNRIIIADIPGLIDGASQGKGLGDLFLRHIERTRIITHLVDISSQANLWENYQIVRNELKNYSKELAKKKEIVVLTKADLVGRETIEAAREEFGKHRKRVAVISAQTGEGLEELVDKLLKSLK